MNLIRPKAPRFYRDVNGVVEACYKVPVKNKKFLMDEGHPGTKEPTIADARELGLLPSVTTILGVLAKPGLERWKLEQAIHSALTLPRLEGESEDAFARRVVQDMEAQAAKAAEFGTRIHDAIASFLTGDYKAHNLLLDTDPYLEQFKAWANQNIEKVHALEKVVGGKHCGYAGRLDLDCTLRGVGRCVVDFKSQAVKEGKEPTFYKDWCAQLGAYSKTINDPVPSIVSLVIDSRAPGPVWPKIWDRHEVFKGLQMFRNCFELWKLMNDYEPGE